MLYDRTVYLVAWAIILMVACVVGVGLGVLSEEPGSSDALVGLIVLVLCIFPAMALAVRFRVTVDHEAVRIHWGLFAYPTSVFALAAVESYRVCRFRPLVDFGGWGWRMGRGGSRCYNLRGSTGVELVIGGRSYIIGVPDPQSLVEAIQTATGRKPDPEGEWAPRRS